MTAPRPPRVSVVIPAYNAAAFLGKALASVAEQTYRDFEVIVIDDGSTDDTAAVAEAFLESRGLAGRCVRQPNAYIAGARNTATGICRGEVIAYLDHDDQWYPRHLERCMQALDAPPAADVVCSDVNVTENGRIVRVHRHGSVSRDMFRRILFDGKSLAPSATVLRKSKLLEIGGFRENLEFRTAEDHDCWIRIAKVARIRFLPEVLGESTYDAGSESRRIAYHHENVLNVVRDNFDRQFGNSAGWLDRVRLRRRIGSIYRSALGQLMRYEKDSPRAGEFALKMMAAFPLDPKNIFRGAQWLLSRLLGR